MLFNKILVCLRGGGDLATGVAYRLQLAGFPVVVLELPQPLVIRRAVALAQAVYDTEVQVAGLTARRVEHLAEARALADSGLVPVVVDPDGNAIREMRPAVLVDARMLKSCPGDMSQGLAPLVVALGPGHVVGVHCHAVVETNRGHDLGRVLWHGSAEPYTGVPGLVGGHGPTRVLRAPVAGAVLGAKQIGDPVATGELVATVGVEPVLAPFDGVLRGLVHDGVVVPAGKKMGDVDPRGVRRYCLTISDKALAIGGGVVEAVLSAPQIQRLCQSASGQRAANG
jgi:xanthine dehydrogenase accessory factor